MNELQILNHPQERQTPIEVALQIDEQGMTTARSLYAFLELASGQFSRWSKSNILDNQFAIEFEDYWGFDIVVEGNPTADYKLTSGFAKKLCMISKSLKGEEAREYFVTVEQNAKKLANKPQTQIQILAAIAQQMAEQEQIAIAHTYQLQLQESRLEQVENKIEKRLTEDFEMQLVTPTQLGKMFEPALSGKAMNQKLRASGLQWKVGGEWVATVDGKKYSSSEPIQLPNGEMKYQLKWQRKVKELIN